jgi:hypothetical protein
MRNNPKSRIEKLEKAVQAKRKELILVWKTVYWDLALEDTIESLIKPLAPEGIDIRRIPYELSEETRAWILKHWDQLIPEAREVMMEKMEDRR